MASPPDFGFNFSNAVDTADTSTWLYGFELTSPPASPIPGVSNQGPPNTHDLPIFATGAANPNHPFREITKDTQYTMYLMWKSEKGGAIWVPLKSADWFYKFKATSMDGLFWTLAPAPATDWERGPAVVDQTEHPEWTSHAQSHDPEALP